ncbi:Penicillin acylase 2 proenzyme [Geodia barretti]|uniref:Penicillin acylase 2 proenzyme n=1 Tax=Geodia barretti TaxID=519541 RepID=A0AA35WIL7_GEOBA|nr:Penicillin acylase 2 proenzyme [Geodia barretti]
MARVRTQLIYMFPEDDRTLLPEGETWPSMMSAALGDAISTLQATLGDDLSQWRWDRLHQARPQHTLSAAFPELAEQLDPSSIPMSGDGDTPLAGAYSPADLATVGGLSVARYAYDLADWDNSLWAIPLGASGNPGSPHYHDQSETWRKPGPSNHATAPASRPTMNENARRTLVDWDTRGTDRAEQFLPDLDPELEVDVEEDSISPYDGGDEYDTFVLFFSHASNPDLSWTMAVRPDEAFINNELEEVVRRIYFQRVE